MMMRPSPRPLPMTRIAIAALLLAASLPAATAAQAPPTVQEVRGNVIDGQSGALMQIPFLILMFVVFYFLLIRPQTKRAKEHRAMVAALEVGAEVVTNGGVLGKVTQVGEQYLTVEIADGVNVKVQRGSVAQVLPKGTLKSV